MFQETFSSPQFLFHNRSHSTHPQAHIYLRSFLLLLPALHTSSVASSMVVRKWCFFKAQQLLQPRDYNLVGDSWELLQLSF